MECQWRKAPAGIDIVKLQVNGTDVDDNRMYTCGTSDFFVGQAKGYIGMEIEHPVYLRETVFDAVEKAVRKAGDVTSRVANRFQEVQ